MAFLCGIPQKQPISRIKGIIRDQGLTALAVACQPTPEFDPLHCHEDRCHNAGYGTTHIRQSACHRRNPPMQPRIMQFNQIVNDDLG
jgi:hypothetical protein